MSTPAASVQSTADTVSCASASRTRGEGTEKPRTRTGARQIATRSTYATATPMNSQPTGTVHRGHGSVATAFGADTRLTPPSSSSPRPASDRIRENDERQILGGQSPARVEPVADGRAGQRRKAHIVGHRVREKRHPSDVRTRQALADVGHRHEVVSTERDVTERRQKEREQQRFRRGRRHVRQQRAPRHFRQLVPENDERGEKERQPNDDESARCTRPFITLPWRVLRNPGECGEQALIEVGEVVAESVIGGIDHPEPLRVATESDDPLRIGERRELVVRRVHQRQRQRRHLADERRCAERGLVRDAVSQVDQRIPPPPSSSFRSGRPMPITPAIDRCVIESAAASTESPAPSEIPMRIGFESEYRLA